MENQQTRHWLRLKLTSGLGRRGLCRLIEHFGDPRTALAEIGAWGRSGIPARIAAAVPDPEDPRIDEALRQLDQHRVRLLHLWQDDYPSQLASIPDPPPLLLVRGRLPRQELFAVVGSRRASPAGLALTRQIGRTLAGHSIGVVSGLARGIDTAAHLGALDGEGETVAVLGCGIDQVYPQENAALYARIEENGAILSEYLPGTPPLAGHFPGRNRIISGLCRGLLVVEAATGSGSLISADFALQQGREVFAVPGGVDRPTSSGVNQLIKEGAQVVTEGRDILERLWPQRPSRQLIEADNQLCSELNPEQLTIYKNVDFEPRSIDDLARKCALTPMEVSAILLHLELAERVVQRPGGRYVRAQMARPES